MPQYNAGTVLLTSIVILIPRFYTDSSFVQVLVFRSFKLKHPSFKSEFKFEI